MCANPSETEARLHLCKIVPGSREEVFKAWTDPEILKQWVAPSDDYTITNAEIDLKLDGHYIIDMKYKDGTVYHVKGKYKHIQTNEHLTFTWIWEGEEPEQEINVTVEFNQKDGNTEIILIQNNFLNEASMEKHKEGWTVCLNRLKSYLELEALKKAA